MKAKAIVITIILIATVFPGLLLVGDAVYIHKKVVKGENGVGTISSFNTNDSYIITGEWEVYKDHLIVTENSDLSSLPKTNLSSLSKNLKKTDTTYYYSYRMVIKGVNKGTTIAFTSNSFLQGYAVYFNKTLVKADNQLVNKDGTKITLDGYTSQYYVDTDEIEIIVELSNRAASYYAFVNYFYLDSVVAHPSLISFQALHLVEIVVCSLIFILMFSLCFTRKHFKRDILFASLSLLTVGAIFANTHPLFFSFPPVPGIIEKMVKYLCYYTATIVFAVLAKSNICRIKFKTFEYALLGSIGIAVIVCILIPIQFIDYICYIICGFGIVALIVSIVSFIKSSEKNIAIQVPIVFLMIETVVCYVYEIVLISHILKYNSSSITAVLFLSCIMLTYLNLYLRDQESEQSSINRELSEKIRDTEFTFLNSQIQSHFIYNTLNAIQSLCNTDPAKASELVEEFSFYLRNRLEFNKMPNLINLEDEIEHIKTYINIEQTRFGDNIKCIYDLSVTDIKIPPLSVQPLVENAVKHGISKQVGGGIIIITTYQDKKNVYIRVKDNGLGFDIDQLKDSKRVGFNNIKDRLSLYLDATIKLDSKIGVGTVVTITIPKKNLTYDNTASKPL